MRLEVGTRFRGRQEFFSRKRFGGMVRGGVAGQAKSVFAYGSGSGAIATRQSWSRRKEEAVLSGIEFIVEWVRIPTSGSE